MRILTSSQIERLLPMADAIACLKPAMMAASRGDTILPLRPTMEMPKTHGKLVLMPGYLGDPASFGVKIVSKFPREAESPHGTHVGAVMLFDAAVGIPVALLEGGTLTAIRTAAASGLATDALARRDSRRLAILGAGAEARTHLAAMRAVRPIEQLSIWNRSRARAEAFAAEAATDGVAVRLAGSAAEAVADADIVCTVTAASTPILFGADVRAGTHLNLVGAATASAAEVDGALVRRSRFYTDYRPSAFAQAGELLDAIRDGLVGEDHVVGEIGQVLAGTAPERGGAEEITIYKSLGIAAQDLAAGLAVLRAAEARGVGTVVELAG